MLKKFILLTDELQLNPVGARSTQRFELFMRL